MKVAFLSQPWETIRLPVTGGSSIATITYHFARRLVAAGDRVVMYSKQASDQAARETDDDGIEHIRLSTSREDRLLAPAKAIERLTGFGNPTKPFFASSIFYGAYARAAARSMKDEGCDVVHIHNFSQFAPIIRAILPEIRTVLHMHCNWLTELDRTMIEERLGSVDLVIGCSDHLTEGARRRFPALSDRFHTVYNGADVEHFSPPSEPPGPTKRLVYVGRVSPEKGVHVLVPAFSRVLERHPDATLHIVGQPGLLAYEFIAGLSDDPIVATIRRYYGSGIVDRARVRFVSKGQGYLGDILEGLPGSVRDRIAFDSFIPHDQLPDLLRSAAMIILPSVCHEAFGMPLVEAMACGTPAVSTKSGGAMEIVRDGRTGLLVDRNDSNALADAIVRLLDSPEERRMMGAESRRVVLQEFAWEKGLERLHSLYRRTLGGDATIAPTVG